MHPDVLPELRKSKDPAERRNDFDLVLAMLAARSPLPRGEWHERYEARFREMMRCDDGFRELVMAHETDRDLTRVQERLDG